MTNFDHPKAAPKSLSAAAKKWWRRIMADFEITDLAGQLLLQAALEAFDRMGQARAQINKDGPTFKDRFGQLRCHPCVSIERDARAGMVGALRSLKLDVNLGSEK